MNQEEFIRKYEKEGMRIKITTLVLGVVCAAFFVVAVLCMENAGALFLCFVIFLTIAFVIMARRDFLVLQNVQSITRMFTEDLDIEKAFTLYQELLRKKKRTEHRYLFLEYMNLLLVAGRFGEFEELYNTNKKTVQRASVIYRQGYRQTFAGMMEDRSCLVQTLSEYKYSKYHNAEGTLTGRKASMRLKDEWNEICLLYEKGEYEAAFEKTERAHAISEYDKIQIEAIRQRCLYHLGREYQIPDLNQELLCIKRLQYLVHTGEEYRCADVGDFFVRLGQDEKMFQKKNKRSMLIFLLMLLAALVLFAGISVVFTSVPAKGKDSLSSALETVDLKAERVYGSYEKGENQAGIVYGTKEDDKAVFSSYYMVTVCPADEGLLPKREIRCQSIGFCMEEGKTYTLEMDGGTYVAFCLEKNENYEDNNEDSNEVKIYYDGQQVTSLQEEIPVIGGSYQTIITFAVEGEYDQDKMTLKSF